MSWKIMTRMKASSDEANEATISQACNLLKTSKVLLQKVEGDMSEGVTELRKAYKELAQALERGLTGGRELQKLFAALKSKQDKVTNVINEIEM